MHVARFPSPRATRRSSRVAVLALVASTMAVGAWAQLVTPASAAVVTIPEQGGNHSFEATPGMTVLAGYSFEYVAGSSTVVNSGGADLSVTCKNGATPSQASLTVPMPYQEYLDPAPSSSGWSPSGDQKQASVYQGSLVIGNYCGGTTMVIGAKMGPFTADVYSDAGEALSFRWHYGPVGGPKNVVGAGSSWSATKTVVPDPLTELGADLKVTKTDSPDPVRRGQSLTYTLTVENLSATNSAQGVVVSDVLDANTSFVSSSPASPTCTHSGQLTGGTLTCNLGQLAAGASSVVSITTTVAGTAPVDAVPGSAASAGGAGTSCGTYDVCNRVSLTSTSNDPTPANNSYFQPTNVIRPEIHLVKSVADSDDADSVGSLGETLTYGFEVTNTGNVPLTDVTISDPMFSLTGAACVASLAVGASTSCPLLATQTHVVTASDIANGSVDNTATATGTPPSGGDVTDTDDATMPMQTNAPGVRLDKSVADSNDADSVGSLGETLTYGFVVTNTGNVPLTDVTISDPMFSLTGAPCVASLAAGASTSCPLLATQTHVVTAADVSAGSVDNTATTAGTPPSGPDVTDQDSATIPTPATPAIHLVKSVADSDDADSIGSLGETLAYGFVVTNTGNVPLTNVKISDPTLWLSGASCVASLAVGASTSCPLLSAQTHTVTAVDLVHGSVDNTATAKGTPPSGGDVTDTDDATIPTQTNAPGVRLDKSVADSSDADSIGSLGETLTYSFVVTNTGNLPLTDVTISDPMFSLTDAACVASLAVGASTTCPLLPTQTHTVTAADVTAGSVDNSATATGTPPFGIDVYDADDASIPTVAPPTDAALSIRKTVDLSQAAPGDTVSYTLTVRNAGPGIADDVVVTDHLPSGTTYVSATSPCTYAGGTVTCSLGTLAAGDTRILTIRVRVAPVAGGDTSHQHQLDYTKVESHLSLFEADTATVTATCPTGYLATDGSVRLDHVDQGTGTFEDAVVLASGVTPDGRSWSGTVRNDATGQLQAKVNVVCMTVRTTSGEDHSHDVVVTGPVTTTRTFTDGRHAVDLTCGAGFYAITPSFSFSSGQGVVSTRRLADGGWRFLVDVADAAAGTFGVQCLSPSLATAQGHSHDLRFTELSDTVTVPAGQVSETRLTCPDGYKGIVAWADIDPGLLPLGNDPQPITRVFRFFNPTGVPLSADYGLLCVAIRTNGGSTGGDITNTASVATTSADADPADNQDSATFAVSTTGVVVTPRASVVTRDGRTLVALRVKAVGTRTVTFKLFATGKVRGTRLEAGSLLAQRETKLRSGRATVRLIAGSVAGTALRHGKVEQARLVITRNGKRDVRWVRILG